MQRKLRHKVLDQIRTDISDLNVPGMAVSLVDSDGEILHETVGDRTIELEKPVTPDTLFGIGSSTKPITATTVAYLAGEGVLNLSDPVSSHVPYFENVPGRPVTIEELLSHTSGMPSDDSGSIVLLEESFNEDLPVSLDGWDAFRQFHAESVSRRRVNGDHCLYYNSGYSILSHLVEAVTDREFGNVVQEAVFDPLGMDRATFETKVLSDASRNVMTAYYRNENGFQPTSLPDHPLITGPGGLLASVAGLSKFLEAWLTLELPIDRTFAEAMCTPRGTIREFVDGTTIDYGLGWMIRPFEGDQLIGHGGGTGVSASYIGFLRDHQLGIAITTNAQPTESIEEVAWKVLAQAIGSDPSSVIPRRELERNASLISGEYEGYGGIQSAKVSWCDEHLIIEHENPLGERSLQLQPLSIGQTRQTYRTVRNGTQIIAEFYLDGDRPELLLDRVLFTQNST